MVALDVNHGTHGTPSCRMVISVNQEGLAGSIPSFYPVIPVEPFPSLLFVRIYLTNQASPYSLFQSLLPQIRISNRFFRFPRRYRGADETSHCSSTHYLYNIFSASRCHSFPKLQ